MKSRLAKKRNRNVSDVMEQVDWIHDLRSYLLEAITEPEPRVEYIIRQFKRKLTRVRRRNNYFAVTRMREYVKLAIGDRTYLRECRR